MGDYIKREDAKRAIRSNFHDFGTRCMINNIINEVAKVSSNNLVEVVRCKDCKHYVLHTLFGRTQGWCERLCDKFDKSLAHGTKGDDYCSYGERADK